MSKSYINNSYNDRPNSANINQQNTKLNTSFKVKRPATTQCFRSSSNDVK